MFQPTLIAKLFLKKAVTDYQLLKTPFEQDCIDKTCWLEVAENSFAIISTFYFLH